MNDVQNVPARTIPLPLSVSAEARAALATGAAKAVSPSPPIDSLAEWQAHISAFNARILPYVDQLMESSILDIETRRIGDVDVYAAKRKDASANELEKINLHFHGGAWVYAGGRSTALPAAVSAMHFGGTVYAPDYRTAPEHPFPAALDDCFNVYGQLLKEHQPSSILVSGDSAGANLAAAMMFKAREAGLPAPCALFLNTPAVDLTLAGDSWYVNHGVDVVLGGLDKEMQLYRNGADANSPYVSPLFGDFSSGFPPTYIRTGTRDVLLSDSVRLHAALRKAGVDADLYVGEAMPHGGFSMLGSDTPEDIDARADTIRWLDRHWLSSQSIGQE